jgi:hypothetical protein
VRHPTRHQIEHHGPLWNSIAVQLGEAVTEPSIQVLHEAGLGVKELIIAAIPLAALGLTEHLNRHAPSCESVATLTVQIRL